MTRSKRGLTLRELGQAWTSGDLARRYPDHVRQKRSSRDDACRLSRLYPTIGSVPVARLTLDDCERAMRRLPPGLAPATRRQYAQALATLCRLAVYPLRLLPHSPIPPGWLPRPGAARAKAWLYPSEDRQLLGCPAVPLQRRLLWGVLAREGLRLSEAIGLSWANLDGLRGAVRLDANKTDDPRAWALSPGVPEALDRLRAEHPEGPFVGLDGTHAAAVFRADLRTAGVTRAELFDDSEHRQPIRAHDLRATFVTVSLAAGRSETWVMDRTGHRSSVMLQRYRRQARQAAELGLGNLDRLDVAVGCSADIGLPVRMETG